MFFDFLEDGAENKVLRHAKTLVFLLLFGALRVDNPSVFVVLTNYY